MMYQKISVIIPIYNIETYITKCVNSVMCQTYSNLEILLVDDGSTDLSPQICNRMAMQDPRIHVIHKKNGGLSDARNAGLDVCTGDYITFIDGDDYIENDYIEYLLQLALDHSAALSICNYTTVFEDGRKSKIFSTQTTDRVMSAEDALEAMMYSDGFTTSACGKLFCREMFQNVRFPVGKLFEDVFTTYKLFEQADVVVSGMWPKYNYVIRNGSILHSKFTRKKLDVIDAEEILLGYITRNHPNIKPAAECLLFTDAAMTYAVIPRENAEYEAEYPRLWFYIAKYRLSIAMNHRTSIKAKYLALSALCGKKAFLLFTKRWRY